MAPGVADDPRCGYAHAVRRLIVIGASSAIAGNAITRWNWLGVGIATTGVIGYAWSQVLPAERDAKDA